MGRTDHKMALAADIGGTKIVAAVITEDNKVVSRYRCPTLAERGCKTVIDRLASALTEAMRKAKLTASNVAGVSIAAAGIIDAGRGIVTTSPNLPDWRNVPLRDVIADRLGFTTYLINDASAAALAEQRFGAGMGLQNLVYLTVSTGIGGGIVIGGRLYSGADGCAGEIGHMIIETNGPPCHCGKSGCLEALASGWAMAGEAIRRLRGGELSVITEIAGGRLDSVTAEVIALAARRKDRMACEIVASTAHYLGIGLANLTNIFNPDMIVIGGGLSNMGNMLLVPAKKVAKSLAFRLPAKRLRVVRARLGDEAGVVGAVAYLFDSQPRGGTAT